MRRGDTAAIVVAVLLAVAASLGLAYAAQPQKSIQEGVFTEDQVKEGQKVWEEICSQCHPLDIFGPDYMIGWEGATAGELFELLQATMPYESPGILSADEYLEVMVFLFSLNGVKHGEEELPADAPQLYEITIAGPFEWVGGGG
jgi:mono/diheme cytochrome c family protein